MFKSSEQNEISFLFKNLNLFRYTWIESFCQFSGHIVLFFQKLAKFCFSEKYFPSSTEQKLPVILTLKQLFQIKLAALFWCQFETELKF
jgi:cytochrome c oxidase assembly protein Cox11